MTGSRTCHNARKVLEALIENNNMPAYTTAVSCALTLVQTKAVAPVKVHALIYTCISAQRLLSKYTNKNLQKATKLVLE